MVDQLAPVLEVKGPARVQPRLPGRAHRMRALGTGAEQDIDAVGGVASDPLVKGFARLAELQHVPEDGHPAAPDGDVRRQVEGGANRAGVGVVTVVDHPNSPSLEDGRAHVQWLELPQGGARFSQGHAAHARTGDGRQGVVRIVAPRDAEIEGSIL